MKMTTTKHTLIAMQNDLGHGHGVDILLTTQERVDNNEEPIAKDIVNKKYAEFIVRAANSHEELLAACKALLMYIGMNQGKEILPNAHEMVQLRAAMANVEK